MDNLLQAKFLQGQSVIAGQVLKPYLSMTNRLKAMDGCAGQVQVLDR